MMSRALAAALAVAVLAGCADPTDDPDAEPSPSATTTSSATPSTSATPTEPVDPGPVVECPARTVEPDPSLPDAVPEGATSVRLCDGGADEVTPPVDALTTEVAAVVEAVNRQPVVTRNCADRQLPAYQLAFGYPDGTSFVVAGRFTACAELLVGSARRAKAQPPLTRFLDLLQAQRTGAAAPPTVDAASIACDQPRRDTSWPLGDPAGLAVAALCIDGRRVVIPSGDLETLVGHLRGHVRPRETTFGCHLRLQGAVIVGATAWGDPVTLTWDCLGFLVTDDLEWRPHGESARIVARLVDRAL